MTSKHWALVGGAVACLITSFYSGMLIASPWVAPGDVRARYAAQKLADRGHLDRTVTTWPLMWGSLDNGLDDNSVATDTSAVASSRAYLRFEQGIQAAPGFHGEMQVAATTDPVFARDFRATPRENGTVNLDLQWQGEAWALGLNPTVALNPDDDQSLRLDGSYLAGTAANWVFGVGAIDRWWGPGWQSSLILSNNARPIPAVWVNRKNADAPSSDWLSWVGPWQFTAFAGQLEHSRVVPDAKLIGLRLTLRPFSGLDIGFSRAIMLGGEGRPENGSTLWHALIGKDNGQFGQANDPGNQLGSIDVRYGFAIGQQSMGLYAQTMGEDEAGAFPARKSWLLGTDWTSQIGTGEQQWFAEYANTTADDLTGDALPNITYDHSIYRSGYRHYGRSMAASVDGDAEAFTFGVFQFNDDGSNLGGSLTAAKLNRDGMSRAVVTDNDIFYSVPVESQSVAIAKLSYGTRLLSGWIDLDAQYADKKIRLMSGEKDQWSLGATWRLRF